MANANIRRELSTWSQIAAYLGVSVRQAQNYEAQDGMPVHRMPGARRQVVAYSDELDAWKRKLLSAAEPSQPAPEEQHSPIAEYADTPATAPPRMPPSIAIWRGALVFGSVLLILGLISGIWAVSRNSSGIPEDFEIRGHYLIVKNGDNRELWYYKFPRPFNALFYQQRGEIWRHIDFADIDGDGQTETLIAYHPDNYNSAGSELYCFSEEGNLRWHFAVGQRTLRDNFGQDYFPPYWINGFRVLTNPKNPNQNRIFISSNHHFEAPDQIAALDSNGRLVGEYWHPGHLLYMELADLKHTGSPMLLLGGVNNGHHAATLLAFDPEHISGTATNLSDRRFGLQGLPPGTEERVLLFPRSCTMRLAPHPEPYNRVIDLRVTKERIFVVVVEGTSEANSKTIIYELDYDFHVISAVPSVELQNAHADLVRSGLLNHPFVPVESSEIKSRVTCLKGCQPVLTDAVNR